MGATNMIILKNVPGLTDTELLEALNSISDREVTTGYGGFVVDEDTAERFLATYLIATGKRQPTAPAKTRGRRPTKPPRSLDRG